MRKVDIKTRAGVKLTKHEVDCVNAIHRLAKKWNSEPNRLWLFSANGKLNIMLGEGDGNDVPEYDGWGCVNQDNCVMTDQVDIENDGGDW